MTLPLEARNVTLFSFVFGGILAGVDYNHCLWKYYPSYSCLIAFPSLSLDPLTADRQHDLTININIT